MNENDLVLQVLLSAYVEEMEKTATRYKGALRAVRLGKAGPLSQGYADLAGARQALGRDVNTALKATEGMGTPVRGLEPRGNFSDAAAKLIWRDADKTARGLWARKRNLSSKEVGMDIAGFRNSSMARSWPPVSGRAASAPQPVNYELRRKVRALQLKRGVTDNPYYNKSLKNRLPR